MGRDKINNMLFNLIPNSVKQILFPKKDTFYMFIRKSQNLTGALFMSISMAGYVLSLIHI